MNNLAPSICSSVDDTLGPWAGQCRGGFDFTLLFEESILAIPLLSIFLLVLPFRLFQLGRQDTKTISSPLKIYKVITTVSWTACQLALLIIWTLPSSNSMFFRTRATIPTATLSFVAALGFTILSWYEHARSVRPAFILDTFLFFSLLFDAARARTLWLMKNDSTIPALFSCTIAVRSILIILESTEKRSIMLPPYASYPREAISGSFSRSVFFWLTSLFLNGYKNILSLNDLFPLDEKLRTQRMQANLKDAWDHVTDKKKGGAFMYTWIGVQKWDILAPVFPRLCQIGFTFSQPFLVTRAIDLASAPNSQTYNNVGYGLIGAYALVYTGIAISDGRYKHKMNRVAIMMRGSVIPCIFRKTLRLQSSDINPAAALSLINTDIETVMQGVIFMHEVWAGLVEISIAVYLLYRQVGAACAIPVAFSVAVLIVSGFIAVPIGTSQAAWIEAAQLRVANTSNTLGKIQWLRISGLNDFAFSNIRKLRDNELKVSRKLRVLTMWILTLATCTPIFSPVLTFITFSALALRSNDTLTISKIFTSLSLFVLFSAPLSMIIVSLPNIAAAVTSFGRIQDYLNTNEHQDRRNIDRPAPETGTEKTEKTLLHTPVLDNSQRKTFTGGDSGFSLPQIGNQNAVASKVEHSIISLRGKFTWPEVSQPSLSIDELCIRAATLTMILGPVGCGKSILLKCMLGEMPSFEGTINASYSGIAYCDQFPFLPNSTIRELITCGSKYDPKWFQEVLVACALEEDLSQWPEGEFACVGSKGISLSGGQKQRLAIARAVYSRKEFVIFDDSFSGLDSRTENKVFNNLLGKDGLLRRGDITVVLASSDAGRASYANQIVSLAANGTILEQGSFEKVCSQPGFTSGILLQSSSARPDDKRRDHSHHLPGTSAPEIQKLLPSLAEETYNDTRRQTGDSTVYKFYLNSAGRKAPAIFVASMVVFAFCDSFPNIWLKWWAEANAKAPNENLEKWLTVYAALAVGSMIFLLIGTWQIFITCISNSGIFFHDILVKTVSRATMNLFTTVDLGVTINRFSQDLQLIDMELPTSALGTACTFVFCIASAVLMCVASKYFAIVIPFVFFVFYLIQHFYLRTSRQMRFLDIEHKAPLYSQLIETLNGLLTIRAFKWEREAEEKNWRILDDSQRPAYLLYCLQQWLIFSVNIVVAIMAIILITLTTTLRGSIGPGYMGIAMINIIAFGETTKALIQTWVALEISIGAVARIKNFVAETALEESDSDESSKGGTAHPPEDWPSAGAIEIKDITGAYPTTGPIIQNLTLSIAPGEKIGICGRTGSGKSSLVHTLFHMLPLTDGSITIDSLPLSSILPSIIRTRVVAVPQEPYIFPSTIRENLDPSSIHPDSFIITTLQKVQLWDSTILSRGGLDAKIDDKFFSHGQAQLFSLARAMLRNPKILVLDEVTSSLDAETEDMVKTVVENEFKEVTVIAVSHRLEFIKAFDRVVVLDKGRIVEVGEPGELMGRAGGRFRGLVELQGGGGGGLARAEDDEITASID